MLIISSIGIIVGSFLICIIIIPIIIRLAHNYKWYDLPNNRKIHTVLVPRLGGVGMFIALISGAILFSIVLSILSEGEITGLWDIQYLPILLGIAIIHIMGLVDDFYNLPALFKLIIQFLAAGIIAASGFAIESISLPYLNKIHFGLLAYPITILWLVGIANSINLVDGMDGLAGGICAFASLSMGIIGLIQGNLPSALFAFAIFGSIAGFLIFNFPPAKIFMGDSGSLLLGFCLAVLPLMGISKAASFGTLIIPITLLTVPIVDTIAAIIRRIINRRPIISPDKEHIHHKLLDLGLGERKILTIIYSFCLYLSVIAITTVILPKEANVYIILTVWIGSMMGYYALDILKSRKTDNINTEESTDNKKNFSA